MSAFKNDREQKFEFLKHSQIGKKYKNIKITVTCKGRSEVEAVKGLCGDVPCLVMNKYLSIENLSRVKL